MSLLYWLYFWQNKEYRLDRAWLALHTMRVDDVIKVWLGLVGRRPQLTAKVLLIAVTTLLILLIGVGKLLMLGLMWWLIAGLVYVTIPLWISVSVAIWAVPSKAVVLIVVWLAKKKIQQCKNLKVVGVTGSYGKTSTKELIAQVLKKRYKVCATQGSVNTLIGVARQILVELDNTVEIYVVEMGAYHRGEIRRLCELVHPAVGVLTGINEQHLGLFGGLDQTLRAKMELIDSLPSSESLAVINVADSLLADALDQVFSPYQTYTAAKPEDNDQAAIIVGRYFGISEADINMSLEDAKSMPYRFKTWLSVDQSMIFDDSHSANPTGFISALNALKNSNRQTKVLVTTGIYELGSMAKQLHQQMNEVAHSICDHIIIVESAHLQYFPSAILIESGPDLYNYLSPYLGENTAILFEGRHRVINWVLEKLGEDEK